MLTLFRFLKEAMNIIDMVAICPFYISLILEGLEDFEIIGKTGKMIRLVSVWFVAGIEVSPPGSKLAKEWKVTINI